MPNLRYVGGDIRECRDISTYLDLSATPFRSECFDAIIALHVLEHIADDRKAIHELHRLLKAGGWALVGVPTRMDQPTFEDPSIVSRHERKEAFGENTHVRFYGYDIVDRLQEPGFLVRVDRATEVDPATREKFGLRGNENLFLCTKLASSEYQEP